MKSANNPAKSFLFSICFILMFGIIVSAQQTAPNANENSSQSKTRAEVSKAEYEDFFNLTGYVTELLYNGEMEKAKESSEQLLKLAETMPDSWNYGNAVHVANLVLGHVALAAGKTDDAKRFLIAAGKTTGSPQLNSFGPNMRLAKALLEKGETDVVIEYFDLCAKFWEPQFSKTEEWKAVVKKNEMPNFGANLLYRFYQPRKN